MSNQSDPLLIGCRLCEGTGRSPHAMDMETLAVKKWTQGVDCQVCKGRGMIRVQTSDDLVDHGGCQGTGRPWFHFAGDYIISRVPCSACKGLGVVPLSGSIQVLT